MYGRVFKRLQAKNKAKGKSSELKTGMESTGTTPVPLTPPRTNTTNDQHPPPDESRLRWDEYESKSADMALFKLHTNATHHPIEPYERSISHDSIFAMATTPPWGNTSLGLGASAASATSGQDNDSVDLTIFIDDDQSCATELFPIYRVRPSLVPGRSTEQEEKSDNQDGDPTTAPQPSDSSSRTRGCRSSLRRSHSGGLDPYLLPPPRFSRFEI